MDIFLMQFKDRKFLHFNLSLRVLAATVDEDKAKYNTGWSEK